MRALLSPSCHFFFAPRSTPAAWLFYPPFAHHYREFFFALFLWWQRVDEPTTLAIAGGYKARWPDTASIGWPPRNR